MDSPIATKFGVCLETKPRCLLHRSWVGYICTWHVQMCPLFHISETAGRIALKFGMWPDTHQQPKMYPGARWGTCARAHPVSMYIPGTAWPIGLKFSVVEDQSAKGFPPA